MGSGVNNEIKKKTGINVPDFSLQLPNVQMPVLPTLGEIGKGVEQVLDVSGDAGMALVTAGYTLTEPGKKDLKNIKKGGRDIIDSALGNTAKKNAAAAEQRAINQQTALEQSLSDQEKRRKKQSEFGFMRTRQRALMGQFGGRSGTILTGTGATEASLGSTGTGKTLLGS
jgi:hypothetical protein